jgi:hypothetical protein
LLLALKVCFQTRFRQSYLVLLVLENRSPLSVHQILTQVR